MTCRGELRTSFDLMIDIVVCYLCSTDSREHS